MSRPRRIMMTGAQTGGHLYPALAVAEYLVEAGCEVTLVTSGAPIEAAILKGTPYRVEVLRVGKVKGMGLWKGLLGVASLPRALLMANGLIKRYRPHGVVGFGGYTSGPLGLAAWLNRIPLAICEQNSIPGLTNRILGRFAKRIYVAYRETEKRFSGMPVLNTGTPIRREVLEVPKKVYGERLEKVRVLVIGGSQGSRFLNERVPPVLGRLRASGLGLEVLHQAGLGRVQAVASLYSKAGIQAEVREYIEDIAKAYEFADFAIARCGAGTVAEITAVGIPCLFIPFALASDNHQVHNARPVVEAGGAILREEAAFYEEEVAKTLGELLSDPGRLQSMAEASRALGRRDAAQKVAKDILELACP